MQIGGKAQKFKLNIDLTGYHPNAKKGAICHTVPNYKASYWGSSDRFVAVSFEKGGCLDILWSNLDKISSRKK